MPDEFSYYYLGIEQNGIFTTYNGPSVLTYDSTYNIYLDGKTDSTGLVGNDYILITDIENKCVLKNCRSINNVLTGCYKIYSEYGEDMSGYYIVKSLYGKLTISPSISITFKSASAEREYIPGETLSREEFESITIYDYTNDTSIVFTSETEFAEYVQNAYNLTLVVSDWAEVGPKPRVKPYENSYSISFYKDGRKITNSSLKMNYGITFETKYGDLLIYN